MQYLLLLYVDEALDATLERSPKDFAAAVAAQGRYNNELRAAGAFVTCGPLHSSTAATTVREQDGRVVVSDGPFAETKEQLGGYYVIEVENLDEAIEWAKKVPDLEHRAVEIRPIIKPG